MNEVENEDLVFTLETIVDKFGEEMSPYALGLCQNLVSLLFRKAWCFSLSLKVTNVQFDFRLLHSGSV